MNVLLIDDHEIVWNGTRRLIERVAAEVRTEGLGRFEAVRDIESALRFGPNDFDLILLDYHLPGVSGEAALEMVRSHFPATPVCMLSAETAPRKVKDIIEAGAAGFLPKAYAMDEMEAALRVVLRHRVFLPAELVLAEDVARPRDSDEMSPEELARFLGTELSPRQRQVLALAVRGLPGKLIARQLNIAEGTVKVHLSMVYKALGARNRTDALYRVFEAQAAGVLGD